MTASPQDRLHRDDVAVTVMHLAEREGTASKLRDLEASAPNPVPKAIKAAMIQAAEELEMWRKLGDSVAAELEEAANIRISVMASISQVEETQKRMKRQLLNAAMRLRAMK